MSDLKTIVFTYDYFKQKLDYEKYILNKAQDNERVGTIVVLDLETTGLNKTYDRITEIALVKLSYSIERKVLLSIDRIYESLEDPKRNISERITEITGISNEMVKGKRIDASVVNTILSDKNTLIFSHNANFDRPFFEKRFPQYASYRWGCTLKDINWDRLGAPLSKKLVDLCKCRGYRYDAHRAVNDSLALVWLLCIEQYALSMILDAVAQKPKKSIIRAYNSYAVKDILKSKNYLYDGQKKCWYKICQSLDEIEDEKYFITRLGCDYQID